jgi:hypothetical protein
MRLGRLAAVIGILLLAPIGAEYLVGYDTSTGNVSELVGNLVIFVPLYGAPALLIRELAVRSGVGWPGRLCWAAAFGIVEAGLVDHSLFNPGYRDISYWSDMVGPTWIPALGFSAAASFGFVVGHVVFSISAPLVVVESIHPSLRSRPWLSPAGTVVAVVGYLMASAFVVQWHLRTEEFVPSLGQLVGAGAVVLALVILGARLRRRPRRSGTGRTPNPWWLAALGLVATALHDASQTWAGFAVGVAVLTATFVAVDHFSRTPAWSGRHLLLLAGGALLSRAATGFLVDPIGDGPLVAKYTHNAVAVLLVVVLVAIGWIRLRSVEATRDHEDVRKTVSADSWTMSPPDQELRHGPVEYRRGGGPPTDGAGVSRSGPADLDTPARSGVATDPT